MVTARLLVLALLAFAHMALAGCQAQATPVPPLLPTETILAQTVEPATAPIHYAFAANTSGFVSRDALDLIGQSALVEQLSDEQTTEDAISGYDVIVAYGIIPDWDVAPVAHEIGVVLNRGIPPLSEEDIFQVVAQRIDGPSLVSMLDIPGTEALSVPEIDANTARTQLARLGYPDGITLNVQVSSVSGSELIKPLFEASNIRLITTAKTTNDVIEALVSNQAHMALANLSDPSIQQMVSDSASIIAVPYYRIAISYLSTADVRLEFSSVGWPIPSR